jgi:histidinol-phosphate aminotransferase
MTLPQPKPGVMQLPIYVPGKSTAAPGVTRVIKLSSNESALGASPKALAAYAAEAEHIHRYPGESADLREALGALHKINPDQIICTSGSDEAICLLCRAYAGPGDEVLYSRHGFLMYPIYAMSVGAKPVAAPEKDLTHDVDALLAHVTERTRIVFIANPNNPTGTRISGAEVARLRAGLREDILLVVDDAYAEYVDAPDYETGMRLASTTPNTVTLRTFSKIYGLAAVRLGWAYGPAPIIDALNRLRSPFNVTRPALVAGIAALADQEHVAKAKALNGKWLKIATQRLRGMGLKVPDSNGNFVLPEFPPTPGKTAPEADAFLQSKGIVVRRVDGYGLKDYLRITLGNDEENEAFLDALAEFMERR